MGLSTAQREHILELLHHEYTIPPEFRECVKDAIRKYCREDCPLTEAKIEEMVTRAESPAKSISGIMEGDISRARGKLLEWIACFEYNAMKNKGNVVMTIVNPDGQSKADLLHIVNTGQGYTVFPGPDVKSGGSSYVLSEWEKIVRSRYDIPMLDMDGVLTTEDGLKQLTKGQRTRLERLKSEFPNKKPVTPLMSNQDLNRIVLDYYMYVSDGVTPRHPGNESFKGSKDNRDRMKSALMAAKGVPGYESSWSEFSQKCREYSNVQSDYQCPMSERISKAKAAEEASKAEQAKQARQGKDDRKRKHSGAGTYGKPHNQPGLLERLGRSAAAVWSAVKPVASEIFWNDIVPFVANKAGEMAMDAVGRVIGGCSGSAGAHTPEERPMQNVQSKDDRQARNPDSTSGSTDSHTSTESGTKGKPRGPNDVMGTVPPHKQRYHSNEGTVWREKDAYPKKTRKSK